MAFCGKCGTQLADGAKFCPSCGAQTGAAPTPQPQYNAGYQQAQQGYQGNYQQAQQQHQQRQGAQSNARDAEENKVMAILAYLGILALIPYFAAPNSRFARYHAIEGLNLCIVGVAYGIAYGILSAIFMAISLGLGLIITTILGFAAIIFLVVEIIGIVNVCKGEMKPLPIFGGIRIIKG